MVQYQSTELVRRFHALGDPTRMAILQAIGQSEILASELARQLNITVTAVLKQLKVLEGAGLAMSRKVGRERHCRVETKALDEIEQWVVETRMQWTFRLDNLEQFLKEDQAR